MQYKLAEKLSFHRNRVILVTSRTNHVLPSSAVAGRGGRHTSTNLLPTKNNQQISFRVAVIIASSLNASDLTEYEKYSFFSPPTHQRQGTNALRTATHEPRALQEDATTSGNVSRTGRRLPERAKGIK